MEGSNLVVLPLAVTQIIPDCSIIMPQNSVPPKPSLAVNSVKVFPSYLQIGEKMKMFDFVYDRKGESKNLPIHQIVSMPNAALAYSAVFWFAAQALRSRMGYTSVFQKNEYDKLYLNDNMNDSSYVNDISVKLLISTVIIDTIRERI